MVICPYCSAPVTPPARVFCSYECERKTQHERKAERRSLAAMARRIVQRHCVECLVLFYPRSYRGRPPKLCSDACAIARRRATVQAGLIIHIDEQCDTTVATSAPHESILQSVAPPLSRVG